MLYIWYDISAYFDDNMARQNAKRKKEERQNPWITFLHYEIIETYTVRRRRKDERMADAKTIAKNGMWLKVFIIGIVSIQCEKQKKISCFVFFHPRIKTIIASDRWLYLFFTDKKRNENRENWLMMSYIST